MIFMVTTIVIFIIFVTYYCSCSIMFSRIHSFRDENGPHPENLIERKGAAVLGPWARLDASWARSWAQDIPNVRNIASHEPRSKSKNDGNSRKNEVFNTSHGVRNIGLGWAQLAPTWAHAALC